MHYLLSHPRFSRFFALFLLSIPFIFQHYGSGADAASLTLSWNKNSEPNVAGYRIHYGAVSRTYQNHVDAYNQTVLTIQNLPDGAACFFAATAYDSSGNESALSAEVAYQIPAQALDADADGMADEADNCPAIANPSQADLDQDGFGDACDPDIDGDGLTNLNESSVYETDPLDTDSDNDGYADGAEVAQGTDPLDASSYPGAAHDNNDSLAAHWTFDDVQGATVSDASGNGYAGTLVGGPSATPGQRGGALKLDGVNDYVDLGTSAFDLSSELTVAFWLRIDGSPATVQSVMQRGTYVYPLLIQISAGRIKTCIRTNRTYYLNSSTALTSGQWYHIALTYGGGARRIYINGILDAADAVAGNLYTSVTSPTYLGRSPSAAYPYYLNGALDDVRLYGAALSASEILSLYSGPSAMVADADEDGLSDYSDNCPAVANPEQDDFDADGIGDECDPDADGDGIIDDDDVCPGTSNPDQADLDSDGIGDACDPDIDGDGVINTADNCPAAANSGQADVDGDRIGDACDPDIDGDGILNNADNCPAIANLSQLDTDEDGLGDACDSDLDGDSIMNSVDNCPALPNADQADLDLDGLGDVCDQDIDGDGIFNANDNCPYAVNALQADMDADGLGDACDNDADADRILNASDNCPTIANPGQTDLDQDGHGDACDQDIDGDGLANDIETGQYETDPLSSDTDSDGFDDGAEVSQGTDPLDALSYPGSRPAGLMAHWTFDSVPDALLPDASGNNNSLSLVNGPVAAPGPAGGALKFDGIDDYADAGRSDFSLGSELTIAFWVRIDGSVKTRQTLIQRGIYTYPFLLQLDAGRIKACLRTDKTYYIYSNAKLTSGQWYHVALTYGDGLRTLYINGHPDNSDIVTGDLKTDSSSSTVIGRSPVDKNAAYLNGAMDDVRIYNVPLDPADIQTLYSSGS